jgi:hypothetical protein
MIITLFLKIGGMKDLKILSMLQMNRISYCWILIKNWINLHLDKEIKAIKKHSAKDTIEMRFKINLLVMNRLQ